MNRLTSLIAAGIVLVSGVSYYLSDSPKADAPAPQPVSGEANKAVAAGEMPKGYQPGQAIRDPFAVPAEFKPKRPVAADRNAAVAAYPQNIPAASREKPVLTGIIAGGASKAAIIQYGSHSQSYKVGEMIGPYQLLAIYDTSVTLWGLGAKLVLTLGG